MMLIFLIISFPVFCQPFFENSTDYMYVDNKDINDIVSIKFDNILPIIYINNPIFEDLTVSEKKSKFIDFILPAILIEKSKIKKAYNYVLNNFDNIYLNEQTKPLYDYCNCNTAEELLVCLTDQPNSIIIAQAAIETGWGTSRFFLEGSNLFGIHSVNTANSIRALGSHDSLPVFVHKYNSILSSISHYLRTLATGYAYSEFRIKRASQDSVINMIPYLKNYSERRDLYVEDIQKLITYNNLSMYDSLIVKWR